MPLTREEFFSTEHEPLKTEPVPVPELCPGKPLKEAYVLVKQVNSGEKQKFEESLPEPPKGGNRTPNFREHVCVFYTVKEDGTPFFTDADVIRLSKMCAPVIERICEKALQLNGISPRDREELEKNFERARLSQKSCSASNSENPSKK